MQTNITVYKYPIVLINIISPKKVNRVLVIVESNFALGIARANIFGKNVNATILDLLKQYARVGGKVILMKRREKKKWNMSIIGIHIDWFVKIVSARSMTVKIAKKKQ